MIPLLKTRLTLVWLVLVGVTTATLTLSRGVDPAGGEAVAAAVLAASFLKVRIVAFEFMELRYAPRVLKHAIDLWLCAIWIALCVLFRRVATPAP